MYIKINESNIKKEIQNCDNQIKNFDKDLQNINTLVTSIGNIWKKEDYDLFKRQMSNYLDSLTTLKNQINSYNSYLKGYLSSVDALHNHYVSKKINLS